MTYTRKDLLDLPVRAWPKETIYRSIALIPTGKKHDSGYAVIALIGLDDDDKPVEIAAYCDDVCYAFPESIPVRQYDAKILRTDMFYPSGITHVWSRYYRFKVGASYSSTEVLLIAQEQEEQGPPAF